MALGGHGIEEGLNMITKYYKEISKNKIILNKKYTLKCFCVPGKEIHIIEDRALVSLLNIPYMLQIFE